MDVVGVDGNRVHVDVGGPEDGVPVVLLHGVVLSHRSFGAMRGMLHEAGCRTFAVDHRGHGESDRVSGGYEFAPFVGDAREVVERVAGELGPVMLVGHSLGGAVAAAVAQQRWPLVAGAVLLDPALRMASPPPAPPAEGSLGAAFRAIRRSAQRMQERGVPEERLAQMLARTPSPFGVPAIERYHEDAMLEWAHGHLHLDVEVLDPVLEPPADHDGSQQLDLGAGLHVPTIVLGADLAAPNRATTEEHEATLTAASPDLTWVRPEGAGHNLHDERDHRAVVHQHVLGMLDRVRDARAAVAARTPGRLDGERLPSASGWVQAQVDAYEASGGREGTTVPVGHDYPCVVYTCRGRTTGRLRSFALIRVEWDGAYALVASKGGADEHPAWYRNLVADPTLQVQDGDTPFLTTVRELEGDEYDRWWERAVRTFPRYADYAAGTDRRIPVLVTTG